MTSRARTSLAWTNVALGTWLICLIAYASPRLIDHLINSDTLLPALFSWELRHIAGAHRDLQLPRIPSFVPDLVFYIGLDAAFGFRWALFLYAVLQVLAFVTVGGAVIARTAGGRLSDTAPALLVVFAAVMLVDIFSAGIHARYYALAPVLHFGALLWTLLGALLVAALIDAWRWPVAILLVLCCFLGFLSNRILAVMFFLPSSLALLTLLFFRALPWRRVAAIIGGGALGTLAAILVDRRLYRQPNLAVTDVWEHVARFATETPQYLRAAALSAIVSLAIPLAMMGGGAAAWIWRQYRARGSGDAAPTAHWATLYLWICAVLSMSASVGLGAALDYHPNTYRDVLPALFLPVIVLAAFLWRYAQRTMRTLSWMIAPVLACVLVVVAGTGGFVPSAVTAWRGPIGACLLEHRDRSGLRAGLAEYWIARPAMLGTDFAVQVDQMTEEGHQFHWGNNRNAYHRSIHDPSRPPDYRFIVIDHTKPDAIRAKYGEPTRIETCGTHTLWIYDDGAAVRRRLLGLTD